MEGRGIDMPCHRKRPISNLISDSLFFGQDLCSGNLDSLAGKLLESQCPLIIAEIVGTLYSFPACRFIDRIFRGSGWKHYIHLESYITIYVRRIFSSPPTDTSKSGASTHHSFFAQDILLNERKTKVHSWQTSNIQRRSCGHTMRTAFHVMMK